MESRGYREQVVELGVTVDSGDLVDVDEGLLSRAQHIWAREKHWFLNR